MLPNPSICPFGAHLTRVQPTIAIMNSTELDFRGIGHRILLARRDAGKTQAELAELVAIDRSYVTNIERGRSQNIGISVLYRLAEALNVEISYLLGLETPPPRTLREKIIDMVIDDEERRQIEQLISLFGMLSDADRQIVLNLAQQLSQRSTDTEA